MNRSKKIVIVCHCVLNANSKIEPLAKISGVDAGAIASAVASGAGIFQLPCPENSYLGMNRWGMTKEQYNHENFCTHCRKILKFPLREIAAFIDAGYEISEIIGVDGSPNCGINQTCKGFSGGEICSEECVLKQAKNLQMVEEKGVFMEVLLSELEKLGAKPKLRAIKEN